MNEPMADVDARPTSGPRTSRGRFPALRTPMCGCTQVKRAAQEKSGLEAIQSAVPDIPGLTEPE